MVKIPFARLSKNMQQAQIYTKLLLYIYFLFRFNYNTIIYCYTIFAAVSFWDRHVHVARVKTKYETAR